MSDIINVLMMRVPAGKDPAEIAAKIGQVRRRSQRCRMTDDLTETMVTIIMVSLLWR